MNARLTLTVASVAILLLLGRPGLGQDDVDLNGPPQAPPMPQTLNANAASDANTANGDMLQAIARAIEDLKSSTRQDFSAVSQRLDQLQQNMVTRADLENYVERSEFLELQRRVEELQESLSDQAAQISQFRQEMNSQVDTLQDQAQQIQQVVDAISRPDSQNRPILDINSSMQSQEFQQEFSGAVNNTMQRQGRLRVTNQMSTTQYLRVNGQMRTIPPFTNADITVPVGTLTTELPGEAPKNWTIAPPTYEQGIIIAPRTPTVVASPVVVYSPY